MHHSFKPQLKTLGRRFGKNINAVREILAGLDGQAAMAELKEKGTLTIQVEGVDEALAEEDLLIEAAQMDWRRRCSMSPGAMPPVITASVR